MPTVKYRFIGFLLFSFFLLSLSNIVQAASYISISKTIRSDFDNLIDLTSSNPNDGSRDVVFRITINNTGNSSVHVHATDDLGNGQFYSADPSAPYDRDNILVPAYGKYEYDFRARYKGSNTTHGAAITSTARIIWIDGCYNYYQGIDCGVHGSLSSSQTVYIHNPAPPNQPPLARFSMTSQGQTVYEGNILNLLVAPGRKAHVDFSASRSSDPDGYISSYQWLINGQPKSTIRDFDDYFSAGIHQIRLDVWDNQGAQGAVGASIVIEEVPAPHITSISPTKIGAGTFDLTINGSNFDNDGAVDKIFWKAEDRFVGQGTILSRSSTRLVVREFMEGTSPGTYVVKVENPDGQISNGIDLEIINQPPVARFSMTSQGQTVISGASMGSLNIRPGILNVTFPQELIRFVWMFGITRMRRVQWGQVL
ncbi:MAG: IPT/TIG domain-containing protein [Deltaproteobacteria bacterium]|nr:IPT/TIG domain-containing protein [Deltaproteobacteria bacterium]